MRYKNRLVCVFERFEVNCSVCRALKVLGSVMAKSGGLAGVD